MIKVYERKFKNVYSKWLVLIDDNGRYGVCQKKGVSVYNLDAFKYSDLPYKIKIDNRRFFEIRPGVLVCSSKVGNKVAIDIIDNRIYPVKMTITDLKRISKKSLGKTYTLKNKYENIK